MPELRVDAAPDEPLALFEDWYREALSSDVVEPSSIGLATVDASGQPSLRMVLLKGYDTRGFVFFTNYQSRKAGDLESNSRAALTFWWGPLYRQIRIEGLVDRVAEEESDAYFSTRPRGSQIGAWASPQSRALSSRADLEASVRTYEERYEGRAVPRPSHWGGYRLEPSRIEFWQGQLDRLHDRLVYQRSPGEAWALTRIAP